jgi:hypothetical protein
MHYTYAHRPVPQAATHHLMDTWGMLRTLLLPCGESARPQGMDWELHGLQSINLLASLGTRMNDPVAVDMEKVVLQRMRTWQEMQNGDLAVPGSSLGFTRHSIVAEQTAYGFLAHKLFPLERDRVRLLRLPAENKAAMNRRTPEGVWEHHSVGVIVHRTESKLLTFSWKNRIMGTLIPTGEGHLGNPHFTVPILDGFVGSTELSAGDTKIRVAEYSWQETPTGFETTGVLLTNGGQVRQTIKVSSIGEKTVVYQDRLTALSDVSVTRELGVPFGIENDRLSGGKRTLYHEDGTMIFDWEKPQPPVAIPGRWANVDGRLGVVTVAGSGMTYSQAAGYNAQAVCADILYGSFSDQPCSYKAGDEVANRTVIFVTWATPEETSALAESSRIEDGHLHLRLPEVGDGEVGLL